MPSSLFINSKIWQTDGTFLQTFGIRNNHIDFVGTNQDASFITSHYDKIIDLNNKLVLPGLIDGHVHLVKGSLTRKRIDCSNIHNLDELKQKIRQYKKSNPNAKWLIGGNPSGSLFDNPVPNFLDLVDDELPLLITNYDYHSAFCNKLAFKRSGLPEQINKFSTEEIPASSEGKPTGVVKEKAMDFIFENLPEQTLEEKCEAVEEIIDIMHSYGITGVSDITLPEDLEVYNKLFSNGSLEIRINSYLPLIKFREIESFIKSIKSIDSSILKIKGFKAFYDGALGSETALFKENYIGKNYKGYKTEIAETGLLLTLALEADAQNWQLAIHAIGDLAVSEVLDIYEELIIKNGKRDRRGRIEHAQHIDEREFERFKELGVITSAQPLHMKFDVPIVKQKLPEKIVNRTHNYRALFDIDNVVNFGTDFPIVEINPFENIKFAVTRRIGNDEFLPQYKINLNDCLKAYTINNAYAAFSENLIGSISPGKFADFLIMEDDLTVMNYDEIGDAKVFQTYFDGRLVYHSS